jgi:hypothetical protein
MLFSSTARRRPSLSSSLAANSFSARALATISRPFGVGQQNRVGHRVDDREEQRPLAPQPARFLGQAAAAADLLDLLAEHRDQPLQVATVVVPRLQQQQADRRVVAVARPAQRNRGEGAVPSGVGGKAPRGCPLARECRKVPAVCCRAPPPADRSRRTDGHEKSSTSSSATPLAGDADQHARLAVHARQTARLTPTWRVSQSRLAGRSAQVS